MMDNKILKFALEAKINRSIINPDAFSCYASQLEAFANLIRQDEREQCAKICEEMTKYTFMQQREHYDMANKCAKAIRERDE